VQTCVLGLLAVAPVVAFVQERRFVRRPVLLVNNRDLGSVLRRRVVAWGLLPAGEGRRSEGPQE
jgi:hypothetical protein